MASSERRTKIITRVTLVLGSPAWTAEAPRPRVVAGASLEELNRVVAQRLGGAEAPYVLQDAVALAVLEELRQGNREIVVATGASMTRKRRRETSQTEYALEYRTQFTSGKLEAEQGG